MKQLSKREESARQAAERRRARLDRWTAAIQNCVNCDGQFNGGIDAALQSIAKEAMTIGSLED